MPKSRVYDFLGRLTTKYTYNIFYDIYKKKSMTRKDILYPPPKSYKGKDIYLLNPLKTTAAQRSLDFLRKYELIESERSPHDRGRPTIYIITPKGEEVFYHIDMIRNIIDYKPK